MHPIHRQLGFSLIETTLAVGVLTALGALAFTIYPRVMIGVHASQDKRVMAAGYASIAQVMRSGGAGSFNSDPNSSDGPMSDNPAALASVLKPIDCQAPWGYLDCKFSSSPSSYIDFMSVGTCADQACSSVGPPYNVFSMRVSLYDVPPESCIALLSGMGIGQSATGASAVYVIGSDWAYKPLFMNTATPAAIINACQDPADDNYLLMFDFWPWGDGFHQYPAWGG
ncbi:MAG TPA: type II secretion system protein [Hyphomonadaceae bacterium]|nr:type II secretion system protein [Hyphomonadaceae bacterium]